MVFFGYICPICINLMFLFCNYVYETCILEPSYFIYEICIGHLISEVATILMVPTLKGEPL